MAFGSLMVYGLTSPSRWVSYMVIQVYKDAAIANLVATLNSPVTTTVLPNGAIGTAMVDAVIFEGLTAGTTYYIRVGVVSPVTLALAWSGVLPWTLGAVDPNGDAVALSFNRKGQLAIGGVITTNSNLSVNGTSIVSTTGTATTLSTSRLLPSVSTAFSTTSSTSPLMANTNASGVATISISTFGLQFPFGVVNYNAGTIAGLAPSTLYYVFFDDVGYNGGSVTYQAATDPSITVSGEWRSSIGYVTTPATPAAGAPPSTGTGGGGAPYCTVEGTPLLTNLGTLDNREVVARWVAGEDIMLRGRTSFEQIKNLAWVNVDRCYEVSVDGFEPFRCSVSHTFDAGNGYVAAYRLQDRDQVMTLQGMRGQTKRLILEPCRVLQVSLAGPMFEYVVLDGVLTHNLKPPVNSKAS